MATTQVMPDRAKKCKFFLNGDKTFAGKYIVLNRRRIRNWDSLLEEVTRGTKSHLPIRNICTPAGGTQITNLDDLAENGNYVAAPRRTFKRMDYLNLKVADYSRKTNGKPLDPIRPVEHSRLKVSAKARKTREPPTTLLIYQNDKPFEGPWRITLPAFMVKNGWDVILGEISDRINMPTCVKKLYTMDYKLVTDYLTLESFSEYIAVGAGKPVAHLPYGSHRPKFNNSPKAQRRAESLPPFVPKTSSRNQRLDNSVSSTGSSSHKSSKSQPQGSTRQANKPPPRRKRVQKEEDSVFHAKPVKHTRGSDRSKETDYDKDEGGVFRAKSQREDTMGAKEVDETKDTKVDLPVDQQEAEEVKDEEDEELDQNNNDNDGSKTHRVNRTGSTRSPSPAPVQPNKSTPTPSRATHTPTPKPRTAAPQSRAASKRSTRPQSNHSSVSDTPRSEGKKTPQQKDQPTKKTEKPEDDEEEEEEEDREKAAVKIQSNYKGYQTRKSQQKKQEAATKIQANYRGYKTRKDLTTSKAEPGEGEDSEEGEDDNE